MATQIATNVRGYVLVERIGTGGFGSVYRGQQTTIMREVAIKIIKPELAGQAEFIRRFESEAQLIARLEHPFITPLIDYWRDPDGAYLVMRYLKGGSLRNALKSEPFELLSIAQLLEQIAAALDFAHRNNVIHRDIKPENILLDEDGNAYLADFGIAKDLTSLKGHQTDVHGVVGSLDYISPEQARSEPVTSPTDIYSLGVMVYELIAGKHPFHDCTAVERLYKHINDPLPQITTVNADIIDDINEIILKATQKDPKKRYQDALSFSSDFKSLVTRNQTRDGQAIIEELTMREHEVLQLIADGCSNGEIADRLFVTVSTVKWHIKQLYGKLGVRSRVQAIIRAREMNLIAGTSKSDSNLLEDKQTIISLPEPENPYKGLYAFQSIDARDFFGREDLIQKLLNFMQDGSPYERFLAIVGPSGCGKSSVVKAGLIPSLWTNRIPNSAKWFVIDFIPGEHPIEKLETALIRVAANHSENLYEQLSRNDRGLLRVADIILPADDTELVIVIDQFEEIFTLVESEAERSQFIDLLCTAVSHNRSRIRLIITLRADYYDRPLHYPQLGEMIKARMETVLPLSAKGLERAIRGPAERVGISFETGLVEQIVSDTNYQAGALPLLQYALTELYEQRDERVLTHRAYAAIGGAGGALANRAEEIYDSLSEEAKQLSQQMFMRLVTLGEGAEDTRRRTALSELLSLTKNTDQLEEIIDQYASYRLLSLNHDPKSRQPTVEVAHEAILRQWERLRQWLNESRDDIRQERLVAYGAHEWDEHKRDSSYLMRGNQLETVEKWHKQTRLVLTPLELAFISASIEERIRENEALQKSKAREQRLESRARLVLGALVIVFAVATFIAASLAYIAQENFVRAERTRIGAQAQIALNNGEDVRIPALLALRSLEMGYSPEADAALLTALRRDFTVQIYEGHVGNGVTSIRFSPDGQMFLSTGTDGTIRLWDTFTGEQLQRFEGHIGHVYCADFIPGSNFILSGGKDGTLRRWDIETAVSTIIYQQEQQINTFALSPDNQLLAITDGINSVHVHTYPEMEAVFTLTGHTDVVALIQFSPDGSLIATSSFDKTVRIWSSGNGELLRLLEGHQAGVYAVDFSSDGRFLGSTSLDATIRIWEVETGEMESLISGVHGMYSGEFSPDGTRFASAGSDRIVYIWNVESGEKIQEFSGHTTGVGFVAFTPDGQYLLSAGIDNVPRLWDLEVESEPRIYARPFAALHGQVTRLAAFSLDAEQIISLESGGKVLFWNIESGLLNFAFNTTSSNVYLEGIIETDGFITSASLSVSHRFLLTAHDNGIAHLWDFETGQLLRDFYVNNSPISSIEFAADEEVFVTAHSDGNAYLWQIDTEQPIFVFEGHSLAVNDVSLSSDGRLLATASDDATIRLWDTSSGHEVFLLTGHEGSVSSLAFSPDSRLLISGSSDHTARLWDVQTGEELHQFIGHTLGVRVVIFSPDGNYIVTGSHDQSITVWNLQSRSILRKLVGHTSPITSLSMSADNQYLLSGDFDGTYLWRINIEDVIQLACDRLTTDLTERERLLYDIRDNRQICSGFAD